MPPLVRDQTAVPTANLLIMEQKDSDKDSCIGRVKCVLVGDGAVGKTSLVVSYTTNGYPIEYVPTAFDNYNVVVTVDEKPIRLQLCDTAGQDDFDSLRPLCYPGTDVFLLCFSVVSPTSFHNITDKWLPEIRHHSPAAPLVLVGTQCDLRSDVKVLIELAQYREQPVSEVAARKLAQQIGAVAYMESSALTQKNLKEVFDTAILGVLQKNERLQRLTLGKAKGKKVMTEKNAAASGSEKRPACAMPGHTLDYSGERDKKKKGWRRLLCFS